MNTMVSTRELDLTSAAGSALKNAARFWFIVAAAGQLLFVYYMIAFYGSSTVRGDLAAWNKVLPHGYVPGDSVGNAALAAHILLAAIITLGGLLQLVPQIRARAPVFHRWNGRVYIVAAFVASVSGFYMVWFRGTVGDTTQHIAISINAAMIMLCAAMAWRFAAARNFTTHRRWALRLFLVVNGVWFFRVGLMFWVAVNRGPVGFNPKTFEGPFLSFLSFAQYLLPLAVLELYLRAQDRGNATGKFAVAGTIAILTLAMGVGITVAFMGMWLPRM